MSAWVVLVMRGDAYVPGAIVVAQSLRDMRTIHDIVCMVTPDVTSSARADLATIFDHVISVPYIEYNTVKMTSKKQAELYNCWIDKSFTKWNCLSLVQYKKILLVDADILFTTNCDEIFDLRTPAACFSSPWAYPWKKNRHLKNPYIDRKSTDMLHGMQITPNMITTALHNKSYVGWSAFVLITPSAKDYADFCSSLQTGVLTTNSAWRVTSGADEVSIAAYYVGKTWTHIHQRFLSISWKPDWVAQDIRAVHYHGRKPWEMSPQEWPDLATWWSTADIASQQVNLRKYFYQSKPCDLIRVIAGQAQVTINIRSIIIANLDEIYDAEVKRRITDIILHQWIMNKTFEDTFDPQYIYPDVELIRTDLSSDNLLKVGCSVDNIIDSIKQLISCRHNAGAGEKARVSNNTLIYGQYLEFGTTSRVQELLKIAGTKATASMIMRYVSVGDSMAPITPGIEHVITTFNILNEAFTSPINSCVLNIPDGQFFSEFPDTDGVFGSCGSVFKNALAESRPGNWLVAPPGIPDVIKRSVDLFDKCMSSVAKTVIYIVYKSFLHLVDKSCHLCTNGIHEISCDRYMVVLSSEKISVSHKTIDYIKSIM